MPDIDYLIAGFPGGNKEIVAAFTSLKFLEVVEAALEILAKAFATLDSSGPVDVASFLGDEGNEDLKRDVSARVLDLLADLKDTGVSPCT